MTTTPLRVMSTILAAIGAAAASCAFGLGSPPIGAGIAGALVTVGGVVATALLGRPSAAEIARFRAHLEQAAPSAGSTLERTDSFRGHGEPFDTLALIATDVIATLRAELETKGADARRARLAARGLKTEHAAFSALLDNLGDGIVLFDPSHTPVIANRAARRFFGLQEGTHDAPLPSDLSAAIPRATLRAPLERALKFADPESRASRTIDASDSKERLVLHVQFQEIADARFEKDDARSLAVVLRDVTREVDLDRMKSDFASSVSHELKTPLCSMRAFLEMLIDGDIEGEEAQREHLRLVLDQTDRLTRLIQNLLNLSRLEAGITRMAREPIALPDLLRRIEDIAAPLARSRRQRLAFEVSSFLPTVTGDASLLEQGVLNLVSNAIKYTPEGGSIRVVAALLGREVEIRVIDTGVGIPASALDLIFEKFTRIENNAGLKATGTGLGLPLARFVAEAHGGRIKVSSEVGKGSEFRMTLPLRRATDDHEAVLVGLEGIGR